MAQKPHRKKHHKTEAELDIYNPDIPSEVENLLKESAPPADPGSFASVTAEELRPFEQLADCSWVFLFSTYCACAWQALKYLPSAAMLFTNMVMYSLLSYTKQTEAAAAFGIYFAYFIVFYAFLHFALMEKFAQEISRGYGKRDYSYMHIVVTQGLITMAAMFLMINLPTLIWADKILIVGNIDPRLIPTITRCLSLHIFVLLVQLPADMLNAFCMAQGLESEVSRVGIPGCLVAAAVQFYLLIYREHSGEAFVFGLMANACCSLLNALITIGSCDRATLGMSSLSHASPGLWAYICETISFFVACVGEFLSSNTTQYFIAVRHDMTAMAAFSAIRSSGALMFRLGVCLAAVSRTRINILIGMGKHQIAKNFYIFYSVGTFVLATIIAAISILASSQLATVFGSQSEETKRVFIKMMVFTCLFSCVAEIGLSSSLVGCRAVGKVHYQILMNFGMTFLFHIPCTYLMNFFKLEPHYLLISFGVNLTAISLFAFLVSKYSDWTKIEIRR